VCSPLGVGFVLGQRQKPFDCLSGQRSGRQGTMQYWLPNFCHEQCSRARYIRNTAINTYHPRPSANDRTWTGISIAPAILVSLLPPGVSNRMHPLRVVGTCLDDDVGRHVGWYDAFRRTRSKRGSKKLRLRTGWCMADNYAGRKVRDREKRDSKSYVYAYDVCRHVGWYDTFRRTRDHREVLRSFVRVRPVHDGQLRTKEGPRWRTERFEEFYVCIRGGAESVMFRFGS